MLTVYLSAPPLREPVASKCASFTVRVFNSGNLVSKLGESCTHWFFCWRYSVRGFGFFVYMVKGLGCVPPLFLALSYSAEGIIFSAARNPIRQRAGPKKGQSVSD